MAGAMTTGAVVAKKSVERKSSARPFANLAITSAVAGATTSASIDCATAMCSTADSMLGSWAPSPNRSVMTFSPLRAAKVSGRTNSCAARVITTWTRTLRSCSRRTSSAALYAAIPPATPRATFILIGYRLQGTGYRGRRLRIRYSSLALGSWPFGSWLKPNEAIEVRAALTLVLSSLHCSGEPVERRQDSKNHKGVKTNITQEIEQQTVEVMGA